MKGKAYFVVTELASSLWTASVEVDRTADPPASSSIADYIDIISTT
jgi:hypothetical protein